MRTLLFPSGSSANPTPARAPARVYTLFGLGDVYDTFKNHDTTVTFFSLENVLFSALGGLVGWDGLDVYFKVYILNTKPIYF